MSDDLKEVDRFISSFLRNLEKGLGDKYRLSDDIEFELVVVKTKSAGGGLKVFVADASGKYKKENVSKIKFKVRKRKKPVVGTVKKGWDFDDLHSRL